ncbi:MAG TPA: DUF1464 family protein [Vicinamibacterales bacterium]|jgi:predicted butyrate kinase (DUF1464 family)|nr:DUF1464 family protein [Vicinamibacterales bacterium]
MPRVLGIDPGTISLDLCGLDDGRVFFDRSIPTAEALADAAMVPALIDSLGRLDLVAGPSGYGLPLVGAHDLSENDIRLACLSPPGEAGGIGGLAALMRALARAIAPLVFTPGAIHLPSVPEHRKINRVDLGTADKVCTAALAIHEEALRQDCSVGDVSCILVEAGGAFTAALAIDQGRIVDGLGGTSGPIGMRGAGALDGEVAFLADHVSKAMLFHGGVEDGRDRASGGRAYVEGVQKAIATLRVSVPHATTVVLAGRHAPALRENLNSGPDLHGPARILAGFGCTAKHAAQGAALLAEGLAGGLSRGLVETMGIRDASGTVLDHLQIIDRESAARRIGLT